MSLLHGLDIQSVPLDQIDDALRVGGLDLAIGNLPALVGRSIHRQIALQVSHFTVAPHILAHTDWIVTLPRRTIELLNPAGDFAVYDLPVEIPGVTVTVHCHANFDTHAANRWIRTLVIDQLSDAPVHT